MYFTMKYNKPTNTNCKNCNKYDVCRYIDKYAAIQEQVKQIDRRGTPFEINVVCSKYQEGINHFTDTGNDQFLKKYDEILKKYTDYLKNLPDDKQLKPPFYFGDIICFTEEA